MAFLWFFIGLLLGGCITLVYMCCLQLSCINDCEDEIRELRAKLNNH